MIISCFQSAQPLTMWNFQEYVDALETHSFKDPMEETTLFCVAVPDSATVFADFVHKLPKSKQTRLAGFKHEGAKRQYLTAHISIALFLARLLGNQYGALQFRETEHHKPYIEIPGQGRPIEFNLSHCNKWVALIFGPHPVGIDIEGHRDLKDIGGIAGIVYTQKEQEDIFQGRKQANLELFFRHWSCKEAYLKAEGTGFMLDPKTIQLSFSESSGESSARVHWTKQIHGHSLAWSTKQINLARETAC